MFGRLGLGLVAMRWVRGRFGGRFFLVGIMFQASGLPSVGICESFRTLSQEPEVAFS